MSSLSINKRIGVNMTYKRNTEQEIIKRDEILKFAGEKIKSIRLSKNITIKELSKETKIKESYLLKIKKGKAIQMSLKHVFLIAKAFEVKLSELLKDLYALV